MGLFLPLLGLACLLHAGEPRLTSEVQVPKDELASMDEASFRYEWVVGRDEVYVARLYKMSSLSTWSLEVQSGRNLKHPEPVWERSYAGGSFANLGKVIDSMLAQIGKQKPVKLLHSVKFDFASSPELWTQVFDDVKIFMEGADGKVRGKDPNLRDAILSSVVKSKQIKSIEMLLASQHYKIDRVLLAESPAMREDAKDLTWRDAAKRKDLGILWPSMCHLSVVPIK